jgi:hypothetical protein
MTVRLIKPTRGDYDYQCRKLRDAFSACASPSAEFADVRAMLDCQICCLYEIKQGRAKALFAGQDNGDTYHINALVGCGLVTLAPRIIALVKRAGYSAITYHTHKRGMTRILRRVGFKVVEQSDKTGALLRLDWS